MSQLSTLKENMTAAISAYRDFAQNPVNQTPANADNLKNLQENVRLSQKIYSDARKAIHIAADGDYQVFHDGAQVGTCKITDGEPVFTFNSDQTALVTTLAATAAIIAVGGTGKVVNGELDGFTGNQLYII